MAEKVEKVVIVSSAFTRTVGKTKLDVINARQNPAPKSVKSKWFVRELTGKKQTVVAAGDKKYDMISVLRAREIELKALSQKKA